MTTSQRAPRRKIEFGDFQTPYGLARRICQTLLEQGATPKSILEPTCGAGSFLQAALDAFPSLKKARGADINANHLAVARERLATYDDPRPRLDQLDFFRANWSEIIEDLPDPLLVIGNPPWVTSAKMTTVGGANLPEKTSAGLTGLEAVMGKSNFDISEWILWQLLEVLNGRRAQLAMLCKTTVARKVLLRAWEGEFAPRTVSLYRIDASTNFGVSVEACLLLCDTCAPPRARDCPVFRDLAAPVEESAFGFRSGSLIADVELHDRWAHLQGEERYRWRSGIKHDCARVMELREGPDGLVNGFGEVVDVEPDYLYPMVKGSQVAKGSTGTTDRWMLVPQQFVGDDTSVIARRAPRTWRYLERHGDQLDRRGSAIYRNNPRFSVFGVGDYSFALWKVAIAGLYKRLVFEVVGPVGGRPTVLDDTSYFVACRTEAEADFVASLFNSHAAYEFFSAFVFWDEKRPITARLLRRLDVYLLAREEAREEELRRLRWEGELQPSLGAEF